jgi:hypothetical protein
MFALAVACKGDDRPLHGETGREWAARGGVGAPEAFEVSLDEVLLTVKPYQLPTKTDVHYNDAMSVGAHV